MRSLSINQKIIKILQETTFKLQELGVRPLELYDIYDTEGRVFYNLCDRYICKTGKLPSWEDLIENEKGE